MATNEELFQTYMNISQQMKMTRHKAMRECGPMANGMRGQGRVLALLKLHDGVSTRQMAQILGIRVSSLNELLGKMEARNLIVRTPSEDDKRVMLIELTDEGRAVEMPGRGMPNRMFGCFDDEEREALAGYLNRIEERLGEGLDEEDYERFEQMRKAHKEFAKHGGHGCHGHGEGHEGHGHDHHGHGEGKKGCCHGKKGHGEGHGHDHHGHGEGKKGCCHDKEGEDQE